jgi:hypothetical protein
VRYIFRGASGSGHEEKSQNRNHGVTKFLHLYISFPTGVPRNRIFPLSRTRSISAILMSEKGKKTRATWRWGI